MRTPKDPTTAAFISAVRTELKDRGWSHEWFAAKVGVSRSYMTRRLSGANPPTIEFAVLCANGLNMELCTLLKDS